MPDTVTLHPGLGIDTTTDFARFARALRKAAPEVASLLRLQLRVVGEIVADEARTRAVDYSATVPDSIRVRLSGATVSVIAGGSGVPMGGLLELGNQRQRGSNTFRHPVFGNRAVWVDQPMHPYLAPALEAKFDAVEAAALSALDNAIVTATEEF